MLSVIAIVALAAAVNAQPSDAPTGAPAAPDNNIRASVAECKDLCGLDACRSATDKNACRSTCNTKAAACKTAVETAIRARWQAQNDAFKQRLDDIRNKTGDISTITVADAKAKCNTICDNNAGDKVTACKAVCDSITDARSGLQAAAKLIGEAVRANWDKIVAANPDGAQNVKDAAQKLRDAVATQRAFFTSQRQAIATALDNRIAEFKQAREDRNAKIENAKAALKAYKEKLAAAKTKEERDQIRADAKAQVQQAVDDAKAAYKAAKATWGDKKKALIQQVIAAKAERRANRKVIIASFVKLVGTLDDLKEAAKAVGGAAGETEPAAPATKKRATQVTLVVACENADDSCAEAVNNVISGAVADAADVTVTETTDEEASYEPPASLGDEEATTPTDKKGNSAASMVLGAAAMVCAAMVSMF
jgi:hypothetical protein